MTVDAVDNSNDNLALTKRVLPTLLSCLREYKRHSLLVTICTIIETVMVTIIPAVMALMIDKGISQKSMSQTALFGVLLLVCAAISTVMGYLSGKFAAFSGAGLAKNIRHDVFSRIQQLSFRSIDRFSTGSLITRLTKDVSNIQQSYSLIIRLGTRAPLLIVITCLFSFRINGEIAILFVAICLIFALMLFVMILILDPMYVRIYQIYDDVNNTVDENLKGIRVVKSYNREEFETRKFTAISTVLSKLFMKAERINTLEYPIFSLLMYSSFIVISWVSAHQIVASGNNARYGLTTGDLTALISYALQILMATYIIAMLWVSVIISKSSAKRLTQVLQEPLTITNPEHPRLVVDDGSIVFDHVTFSYTTTASKPVLDDINLTIPSGKVVGIIGATGSSKSSLVQLIPRLYEVTSGSLRVGGHPVDEYDLSVLRDSVAMVLQKNTLFKGTIAENLRWGSQHASQEELERVARLAHAHEFIEELPQGYETLVEQGGSNLSGGQRQRLCIARALLKNPKILILDDSTSAVDMKTDYAIRQSFKQELRNATTLVIAQRISSVETADMIVLLDDGKILATGSHEELLETCEEYRSIYWSQVEEQDLTSPAIEMIHEMAHEVTHD